MLNLLDDSLKSKHLFGPYKHHISYISSQCDQGHFTFPQQPPKIRENIIPAFTHMGTVACTAPAAIDSQLSLVSPSMWYCSREVASNSSSETEGEGVRSVAAVQWFSTFTSRRGDTACWEYAIGWDFSVPFHRPVASRVVFVAWRGHFRIFFTTVIVDLPSRKNAKSMTDWRLTSFAIAFVSCSVVLWDQEREFKCWQKSG